MKERDKPLAIFYITEKARHLGEKVLSYYPNGKLERMSSEKVKELWDKAGAMVFIMASGIVVRTIGPLLKDKRTDPAVVVMDETGRFVISLAGGHLGGANSLTKELASLIGAEPVITTASDVEGLPGLDLWAETHGLQIDDPSLLPQVMKRFVENGALRVFSEEDLPMPDEFIRVSEPRYADIIITPKADIYLDQTVCPTGGCRVKGQLYLRPRNLSIGIGFNKGTPADEMLQAIKKVLRENNLSLSSVGVIASLDKKTEEEGFQKLIRELGVAWASFTVEELNRCVKEKGLTVSEYAEKATGALSVAEPAAVLGSGGGPLIVNKKAVGNVTLAVALITTRTGKLYIVGVGPGSPDEITPRARQALLKAEVVVGYRAYVERLSGLVSGKKVFTTGMTKEIERCRQAIEYARMGNTVALVSSGDPGIYAMAGLVLEIMKKEPSLRVPVEVIPGVSALNAVSARLGAPLMNDFAVISLSDRLTPWQNIEDRLRKAAEGDFVIVLFNPRSKGRPEHLSKALAIIRNYRSGDTPVGIVKAVSRENERTIITTLDAVPCEEVDMETTLVVGNSRTFLYDRYMVTPRGYTNKYQITDVPPTLPIWPGQMSHGMPENKD